MALHDGFDLSGAMRALLGRFPNLEDEPQLGVLLQSDVRSHLSLLDVRSHFLIIRSHVTLSVELNCFVLAYEQMIA